MKIHPVKLQQLITVLHNEHHINEMTENGFAKHQTRLEFQYFIPLRKSTNRLNWETSGVLGPTEKLSAFVAILPQPLA